MTQEKEALKLALEALEREARGYAVHDELQIPRSMRDAIVAIKEVLAQPEQIPPSAYSNTHQPEPPPECPMDSYGDGNIYRGQRSRDSVVKTITLAQPEEPCDMGKMCIGCSPRNADGSCPDAPRKPLTDEQISELWDGHVVPVFGKNGINPIVFARAIEASHNIKGIKNHG